MRLRVSVATLLLSIAHSYASPALADDSVAAESNFRRGLQEMKAGNYATACPALAESQRLEPRPGTLFTLADCEARWGKIATAAAYYDDYMTRVSRLPGGEQNAHRERVALAKTRLAEFSEKIPQLTLVLPQSAPSGTEVRRDDVLLGAPSIGVALAIDPGEHVVTTMAPGGPVHEMKVILAPGDKKSVDLVVEPAAPISSSTSRTNAIEEPPKETQPKETPSSSRRTIGLVVGGVGIAGIAVGAVTGILVLGQKSTVDKDCPNGACRGDGLNEAHAAKTTAMVSTIGFAAGGALLAAGAVLFLTAPSAKPEAKTTGFRFNGSVGPRSVALTVGREW